jgi:hypothetical protein
LSAAALMIAHIGRPAEALCPDRLTTSDHASLIGLHRFDIHRYVVVHFIGG